MVLFSKSGSRKILSQMLEITESSVMPAASAPDQKSNCVPVEQAVLPSKDLTSEDNADAQCALHAQYVLQLLQLQRRAEFLCDITIHVRDRSFKAHKPLLAACSLYFRRLFADAESKESTALNLTSLTPNGFQVLLDYIYSGSLAITAENSSEVLSAATCLQMTNVVETCLNFMRSSFRMTKTNDLQLPYTTNKNSSGSLGASAIPDHSTGKRASKYKASTDGLGSDKLSAKTAMSRPASQDNLQIISTESINEAEFKSMIVDTQVKPSPSSGHTGTSAQLKVTNSPLPSASQLQSVLPILMTNHPRQPTLTEVQQILTSLPNAVDHYPTSGVDNPQLNSPALNLTTSTCSIPYYKYANLKHNYQ